MASRKKTWDVVVVGDFFIDIVMSGFHEFPRLGEEAFARTLCHEIGGGAAITSSGLARLGLKVAALGVVGKDDGLWIVKKLIAAGVNASALENHPTDSSGVTVSVSTSQDRAFFTYYGANDRLTNLLRNPGARALMSQAGHVHFACGPDPVSDADLFSELHSAGCNVSIDVGWHESWLTDPRKDAMLMESDLFFPNQREAALMTGCSEPAAIVQALVDRGIRNFALKLGPEGAALSWRGELIWCPPYPVDAVDTTGAGDCFDAGFIYAWAKGESPEHCMRTANVCGALSTRALGGISGFPSKEELEEAMETVRS